MSLNDLVARVDEALRAEEAAADVPREVRLLARGALLLGWTWTRSNRHAVRTSDLYLAVRAAGVAPALVHAATYAAAVELGGWFVKRGNLRHVRGVRVNHMTDVQAESASRHLRRPWRTRKEAP